MRPIPDVYPPHAGVKSFAVEADARQWRVAENECIVRDVNERLQEGHERFRLEGPQEFLCECGDIGCEERTRLTLAEYEQVRSNPRRFAVLPGHEIPDDERVIENNGRCVIVEKVGTPAAVAEADDPRSEAV